MTMSLHILSVANADNMQLTTSYRIESVVGEGIVSEVIQDTSPMPVHDYDQAQLDLEPRGTTHLTP